MKSLDPENKPNMRLIKYIATTLCLIASLSAQAGVIPEDIQQLRELLQPITSLSAQFEQQITDANGFEMQTSSGLFQVAQPNNLRWIVSEPMPQQVISDGITLWLYDPDLEQVIIQPFDANIESTPAMLFSGDLDRLDSTYFILESSNGVFELTPEQGDSLFSSLQITFANRVPAVMALTDNLGQVTRITLSEVVYNSAIPAELFVFEIPDGIDVIRND
jgi:outer membrane lipoprotein carrier protein